MELLLIIFQKIHSFLIFFLQKRFCFFIDDCCGLSGAGKGSISTQILTIDSLQCHHTKLITHTVTCDHGTGKLGHLLDIIGGTRGNRTEDQLFCCTASRIGCNLIFQFFFAEQILIPFLHLHGIAKCSRSSRNDRDLGDRCRMALQGCHQRMTRLMVCYDQFFLIRKNSIFLLISSDNYFNTLFQIFLDHISTTISDCTESCLIYHICQLCTRRTCSGSCDSMEIYVISQLHFLCMYF